MLTVPIVKGFQLAIGLILASATAWAQDAPKEEFSPTQARALIGEWMQTERLISQEDKQWQLQQQELAQLIALYETEVKMLSEDLSAAGEATQNFDEKTEALKQKTAELKRERIELSTKLEQQRLRLLGITQYFPEVLKVELEGDLLNLKDAGAEPRELLLVMLKVVKSAGKFNRIVSYAEEMHSVGNSTEKRQLRIIYLGLGRAYYVSGDTAGVGIPSKTGWAWTEDNSLLSKVTQAINVYEKLGRPELITLPVEVTQ